MRFIVDARLLLLVSVACTVAACGKKEESAPPPAATGSALEGQLHIVAWPGYIERGETDKGYDWVKPFEIGDRLQGQREDRRHVGRDGVADDAGRLRPRDGFGRCLAAPHSRRHRAAGGRRQGTGL